MPYLPGDEAMLWILKNQLGRRNLSEIQFELAIARQYELEKKVAYRPSITNDMNCDTKGDQNDHLDSRQSGTSPGTCSSTGDQASRNTRNSYSYIWSNQDQDASFLFIYIHLLLSLLFSKVININQSEEITPDFTLFRSVI
jgi:hypothetical protein